MLIFRAVKSYSLAYGYKTNQIKKAEFPPPFLLYITHPTKTGSLNSVLQQPLINKTFKASEKKKEKEKSEKRKAK
ncbi:hypothetical protein BTV20_04715 [Histophilus somni]|nr:hypothetical protein BTV18_04285 [Histophilus somni]ARU66633.1 hypothetical protein BTV19_04710 [Histophilus somni]ARU68507.1 hypothetical protein BTV16_04710 [Histophilus somni]ARU70386.1 hypothetical protein BTV20_04715 [Histophilus somni]ARU72261.1 hypothetical protein BTV17_04705 [Histophilus somni]